MPERRHPLADLALDAIVRFVSERRIIEPPETLYHLAPEAHGRAAAFVCVKQEGVLRGCIGTTEPAQVTLAVEIIHNAISAATRDPRFPAVAVEELGVLDVSVDVLTPPEPVEEPACLDPGRYGIIVRAGERRGVLLPAIEGITTTEEQIAIARLKAGLLPAEPIELFRFEVTRYR